MNHIAGKLCLGTVLLVGLLIHFAAAQEDSGTGAQVFDPQTQGINLTVGQILSTGSNTSRQIQFGLRLEF